MAATQSVPAVPPQKTPPLSPPPAAGDLTTALFTKIWWLFFSALVDAVNALSAIAGIPGPAGPPGAGSAFGDQTLAIVANAVAIDLDNGRICELTINQATQITIQNPTGTGSAAPGSAEGQIILFIFTDAYANRPSPAWGTAYAADVAGIVLSGVPNSVSALDLVLLAIDSKWHLKSQQLG